MSEFYAGGAVPSTSNAYIERVFENVVLQHLYKSEWVLLLGPRQHGKTSGLIRVRQSLIDDNFLCAFVDFQFLPHAPTYEELLQWFANQVAAHCGVDSFVAPVGAYRGDLYAWLDALAPTNTSPLFIIIDEAAGINDTEMRETFYGQIRAITSRRAYDPEGSISKRVRFVFSGTFRPETLVSEKNSPFNTCKTVYSEDLTYEQAKRLYLGVAGEGDDALVQKTYELVGGQPYLLQTIFAAIQNVAGSEKEARFNDAIDKLQSGDDPHLQSVFRKVFEDAALENVLVALLASPDNKIDVDPVNMDYRFLQTIGLIKREQRHLLFRNFFYFEVAKRNPQLVKSGSALPAVGVAAGPLFELGEERFGFMKNIPLKEIVWRNHNAAVNAYNAGYYRMAVIGFGAAVEGLVMDWLMAIPAGTLAAAVKTAKGFKSPASFNKFEVETQPQTWRLVNLLRVAPAVITGGTVIDPKDALREWRNIAHPGVAIQAYMKESELEPEAQTASGLFKILLRDISSLPV